MPDKPPMHIELTMDRTDAGLFSRHTLISVLVWSIGVIGITFILLLLYPFHVVQVRNADNMDFEGISFDTFDELRAEWVKLATSSAEGICALANRYRG